MLRLKIGKDNQTVTKRLLLVLTLCFLFAIVALSLIKRHSASDQPKEITISSGDKQVTEWLRNERILAVESWHVGKDGGKLLWCVFQSFEHDPRYQGSGVKLSIYNSSAELIYTDYFVSLQRVYTSTALRDASSQLIIETNDGGSNTYYLQMLDYRDGKVVKLLNKSQGYFNIAAEVRPQVRSGINAAQVPFQIILTEGVGIASPVEKYTRV